MIGFFIWLVLAIGAWAFIYGATNRDMARRLERALHELIKEAEECR